MFADNSERNPEIEKVLLILKNRQSFESACILQQNMVAPEELWNVPSLHKELRSYAQYVKSNWNDHPLRIINHLQHHHKMRISDLHLHLSEFPSLASLDAADVFQFVTVASHFISINQGSIPIDEDNAPYEYLNAALRPPEVPGTWEVLWTVLYPTLFTLHADPPKQERDKGLIQAAGAPTIAERIFLPPYQDECPTAECRVTGRRLEKRPPLCGYLYDLDGVKSIWHHTTYCRHCKTSFRALYFSNKDERTYYLNTVRRDPDCIQVNMHYFMTLRLLEFFNHSQSLPHSHKLHEPAPNHFVDEFFKPTLSDHCCTTALDLQRLLRHFNLRDRHMTVSNSGGSRHRFREAKQAILTWMELEGSPNLDHMCSECTKILEDPNVPGGGLALRAIAMDGITIGHPRCSATKEQLISMNPLISNPPPCTVMLETPKDRYCPVHSPILGKLCHAQPWTRDAIGTTKACDIPEHQVAIAIRHEKTHRSRAALAFNQRTGAKLPEDPTAALNADTDAFNLDALIETDESDRTHKAGRDGEDTFRPAAIQKKPLCSNAKTHNDLLFVGTCGITLARETMYCAESVILVREILERKFPVLPPIQFFDNSCTFDKSLRKDPEASERLKGTIRPVDPFHMRTHSEKDAQCRKFNDPKRWPFLKKPDGNWRFNGSAAEITNAWYGGFLSICRGMHEINYRFFLEEMIRVRNDSLLSKLVKKTTFCCNIPSHLAQQSPFPLSL
ncbi:uncharacterized protein MELLADRAFT_88266 [Melampsora larici-populina 98AG31]|uniref:CxC5 like cysteine cluster associated with KDZ domain-containing protein n=1 Tax=Melampsora larici-populina (strain 98AG31 / pathotype 3-4-7) TaxID=747676 RepID=F4RR66_MELLP|nr:uncharacterized protein MELLADRAFT_88266 [Melampsora larici-populina 98AG31]EGG05202.1 hypothetical protein MELLADRAFT_88266 [Melampsora larici-populina 98AG31]